MKVRATVIFEWEEDAENWDNPENEGVMLARIKEYIDGDASYVLVQDYKTMTIEEV